MDKLLSQAPEMRLHNFMQTVLERDSGKVFRRFTVRAQQTARRKAIYEELHPETKHGGDRSEASRKLCDLNQAERFTANTATATGQSERVVQLNVERGTKVIGEVIDMITHTTRPDRARGMIMVVCGSEV